jgi:GT2 family glycosyltransferase
MTGTTLGAVVVSYRRYDLLRQCLEALAASSRPPDRIVVVDNESDADALAAAVAGIPGVEAIGNAGNPGYAASCNQGWRAAGTDLVLFLNGDVTVTATCLERVTAALDADPGVGIATARLERPDGTLDHACHRGIPTPEAALWYSLKLHRVRPRSRRFAAYTMSWLDPATEHDIEACSGAFLLVRSATLEMIGGWDEGYWFYAEDLDLCLRVLRAGLRVRYVASAVATHVKGASSNLRADGRTLDPAEQATRDRVRLAIVASHLRFYRLHLAASTAWPLRLLVETRFRVDRRRVERSIRRAGRPLPG